MRLLIRTYTITGQHEITITGYDFTNQDVRLIINETKASSAQTDLDLINSVLVSSTKKGNITSVINGVITLANTTTVLTVGDELTIEVDIDNVAKESNATANKLVILDALAAAELAIQGNDATATLLALKTAIANLPTVALIQNGLATSSALSSVATDASNAATDAAAAKTAAQAITGYALQGANVSATNTAIASTLGEPSDLDTVHTVFGHLAKLKSILDLVDTHVGSDNLTLNEKLDIIRMVIGEISLVQNNDNVGSGNQAWTLVLNQSLAVNNETLEQA